MSTRPLYLAKYRQTTTQRSHFALFTPSHAYNRSTLITDYKSQPTKGTIIHLVGEPLMSGYALQFKRNYECSTDRELSQLVLLGTVGEANVWDGDGGAFHVEDTPRGVLEREAMFVKPPPRGQDVRAPIDGVSFTIMEFTRNRSNVEVLGFT